MPNAAREVVDATQRVLDAFTFTFPPVGIAVLVYALLGDPVFAINRYLGYRMFTRVRRAGRRLYFACNCALFAGMHATMLWGCWDSFWGPPSATGCAARPLRQRFCLVSTSVIAVAHLLVSFSDRVLVPLLAVEANGYAVGWRLRVVEAAAIGVMWLSLSQADASALGLAGALSARRALSSVASGRSVYCAMFLWKIAVLVRSWRVLAGADQGECSEAQRRMAIAVMGTVVVL
jgi:hypothetical protein